MTTPSHSQGPVHTPSVTGFSPRTAAILGGCALVFTAHRLGAGWLGEQVLMLPAGVWLVALGCLIAHALGSGAFSRAKSTEVSPTRSARMSDTSVHQQASVDEIDEVHPVDDQASVDQSAPLLATSAEPASALAEGSKRLARRTARTIDRVSRRVRGKGAEITIGLDLSAPEAAQIMLAMGGSDTSVGGAPVRLRRAEPGMLKNGPDDCCEFDALLRRGPGGEMYLFVHARDDAPAAWADWSEPGPLGYMSVFPLRLDTARVRLGEVDLGRDDLAKLTASVAIAGAVLGRTPARLGGLKGFGSRRSMANYSGAVAASILGVGEALMSVKPEGAERGSGLCRSAARVLSAFVAGTESPLSDSDRLHLAGTAAAFLDQEPESLMRLGALRLACGQTESGMSTLVDASRQLRRGGAKCAMDPAPFVLAEAELASQTVDDRLAFGRLCAGVSLLCGTGDIRTLGYLRDDLIDDLNCSGWASSHTREMAVLEMLLNQLGAVSVRAESPRAGGPVRQAA